MPRNFEETQRCKASIDSGYFKSTLLVSPLLVAGALAPEPQLENVIFNVDFEFSKAEFNDALHMAPL